MDIATIVGLVAAFGLIVWSILLGGSLSGFIDPPSVAVVIGGTLGALLINFPLAKQSIDLLTMVQDKTRGNLTSEEHKLLENLLYDLRMKYVAECKGS